jgi:hypothetical protein
MYSESDLENAVQAGAITPAAAAALRQSVAQNRETSSVDEESFRLLTGFNDIFVTIAAILLLVAVGWIGGNIGYRVMPPSPADGAYSQVQLGVCLGGLLVAGASWGLAEYFTRRRRMALPSILLLLTFVFGIGALAGGMLSGASQTTHPGIPWAAPLAGLAMAAAAYGHWRRFHVPITIAALTGALVLTVIGMVIATIGSSGPCASQPQVQDAMISCLATIQSATIWLSLACGLAVFAFAMWWDMSDRSRITRRSDVAFWLHLGAAPLIAHSVFYLLGVTQGDPSLTKGGIVIVLYLLFGVVALAADRRALLVSSLVYVLYALSGLFEQFGAVSLNMALTALVIGSALLMLSAFWHSARRLVVRQLPEALQMRLPELDRVVAPPRPA